LGSPDNLHLELQGMLDVLLERVPLPNGPRSVANLMAVATAYYARGLEIRMKIHYMERDNQVKNGRNSRDPYYMFRVGELEDFLEACKKCIDTFSRRLTAMQLEFDMQSRGIGGPGGAPS
jgi:hypothetical protein